MRQRLVAFLCVCLWGSTLFAQNFPEQSTPPRLVNDFAGLLTPLQRDSLERKLTRFDRQSSTQIAVVTLSDLEGYDAGDYAQRLFEKWGIGHKGKDNGVLILVKPKTADASGAAFISVGYGLEGVIPDITAGRILDTEMLPSFRQGDLFVGLDRATTVLMQLSSGEFTAQEYQGDDSADTVVGFFVLFALVLILMWIFNRGHKDSGDNDSHRGGRGGWIPPVIIGGGNPFGGSGGGGSFGGFGGFGGGSSGGGGAGRSW